MTPEQLRARREARTLKTNLNKPTPPALPLGDCGYRDAEGYLYRDQEAANRRGSANAVPYDTRMTRLAVQAALEAAEGKVWEECLTVWSAVKGNPYPDAVEPWVSSWDYTFLAAYVVTGGSEGYWLHVDLVSRNGDRKNIVTGKTLARTWAECYASAGRIARMLGA